jgi:hypothetical protein
MHKDVLGVPELLKAKDKKDLQNSRKVQMVFEK